MLSSYDQFVLRNYDFLDQIGLKFLRFGPSQMPHDHLVQNGHRSMTKKFMVVKKRSLVNAFLVVEESYERKEKEWISYPCLPSNESNSLSLTLFDCPHAYQRRMNVMFLWILLKYSL